LPFPTSTLSSSDTNTFLVPNWGLGKGRVEDDPNDLSFVSDPFPNSHPPDSDATGPVLQVDYPANSFSHATGGAQFTSLFNGTQPFHSMLLSYEIAFDQNFDFVKGGKLPGLRGGPQPDGCSGGTQPTGADCFSTRLMWRTNGAAEVYAYIPPTGITCSKSQGPFICNSDFGISINRGAFSFPTGGWSRVSLVVLLNDPPSAANGYLEVYFNDQRVIAQGNLQMRTSDVIDVKGLYFSTFFGGSDSSWATPSDQHTYFRNIKLWGSTAPSNGS
ncbi:polysaccharide lyase family 14 protein, partial [Sistotremastrum niveocremeum HHB9708]